MRQNNLKTPLVIAGAGVLPWSGNRKNKCFFFPTHTCRRPPQCVSRPLKKNEQNSSRDSSAGRHEDGLPWMASASRTSASRKSTGVRHPFSVRSRRSSSATSICDLFWEGNTKKMEIGRRRREGGAVHD